jgi:hypothetical protein
MGVAGLMGSRMSERHARLSTICRRLTRAVLFLHFLSQTGVFSDTPNMVPVSQTDSIYAPNVQLFSDNAQKVRYFSIPNTGAPLRLPNKSPTRPPTPGPSPPAPCSSRPLNCRPTTSDPTSLLRLETRLLVRDTNGDGLWSDLQMARRLQRCRFAFDQPNPSRAHSNPRGRVLPTCGITPALVIVCSATRRWPITCWGSMRAS